MHTVVEKSVVAVNGLHVGVIVFRFVTRFA